MSLSPLVIVAIVIGLLIVVVVVVLLAGGTAWLVLRKKNKPPANRQASAAAQSRPPVPAQVQTPVHTPPGSSAGQVPSRPQKPPAPLPARPVKPEAWPREAAKRPPLAVIEIVDKEQERVAQEMSGAARNWKVLFAEAFDHGTQENPALAMGLPALPNTSPDPQILVDTLNNTASDVSGAIAGLAAGQRETGGLTWRAHLPGTEASPPFLDLLIDLARQATRLGRGDLAAGANRMDERPPASSASVVSLSQARQQIIQARQTVEKAYTEVLSSLDYGTNMAGHTQGSSLARSFDKAKQMLSGGSQ